MILKSGFPFSLIKSGLPFEYPKLETDLRTDVLVMGGGISGALVAHYLIKNGIDCVVADARTIGLGSTCASTSLLQYEIDVPLNKLVNLIDPKDAIRAYQLCGTAIKRLHSLSKQIELDEFQLTQSLYYAAHKKDLALLQDEYHIRKQNGFDIRLLGEKHVYKEFGFTAPGAILSNLAATTNAYLFTHYLHQYNLRRGLKVYDRSEITHIRHTKKEVRMKTANGQTIRAKKLVYATGYEVVDFISKPIVKLQSTYATISEPYSGKLPWKNNTLIWNTADPYLYMRTTEDNRIVVGGRDEKFYSPAKRDKLIQSKSGQLKKDFEKLFPGTCFLPEFSWTGTFGSTKDGLPFIGEYKPLPNSYFALGFGGNGITFSQIAGQLISDLIKGKSNKDAAIFSFDRL